MALLWNRSNNSMSSAGNPELDAVLWMGSHKSRIKWGKNHLLWSASSASFDAAQDSIWHTLLAHVVFSSTITSKSFSAGLLPVTFLSSLSVCLGLPWPGCRTLHLFVELQQVCTAPISILSGSLWVASLHSSMLTSPHSLVSSANFLRVHLVPLSMSPAKILNQLQYSPLRGTTGLHVDSESLTTILCI